MSLFINYNLNKIYLSEAIRSLGIGMIQVFIPIVLLTHGYTLTQVLFFYIIASTFHFFLAIPTGYLGSKIGYKYLILLSVPFFIAFFALFRNVGHLLVPLWALALIREIAGTFYWVSKHSLLGFYADKDKIGAEMGVSKILSSLAGLPAPIIGGFILSFIGINVLLGLVLALLILSVIPLLYIREEWPDTAFSIEHVFSKLHFKNIPIFMTQGVDNAITELVWPVYLYFNILFKYIAVGITSFLPNIASLTTNYITGVFSDRNYKRVLHIGAITTLIIWIARIFAKLPIHVYAIDSTSGITDTFIQLPFGSTSYRIARAGHFLQFIVFREMAIHSGKLLALLVVLAIGSLKYALFLGLIYPFGYLLFGFKEQDSQTIAAE